MATIQPFKARNPALREAARKLFIEGLSLYAIAMKLGVGRSTVFEWTADMTREPATHREEITLRERERTAMAVRERDERLARYAHEYDDLNVRLCGDPPRHRSALAQRENA